MFFFAMLAASIGLMMYCEWMDLLINRLDQVNLRRLWGIGMISTSLSGLLFGSSLIYRRIPKQFYILAGIGISILVWSWNRLTSGWWNPAGGQNYLSLFTLVCLLETLRLVFRRSELKRDEEIRPLGIGVLPLVFTAIYQMLYNFDIVQPLAGLFDIVPLPYYAFLFMILFTSIHLSRSFASVNLNLKDQLAKVQQLSEERLEQERKARKEELERKLLEADNQRKTAELVEARDLQLSMLPRTTPQFPGLEFGFYMKPATEVGGDYYDFFQESNGALTLAIGDATGHGVKAGTMVAAVKSLFQNLAATENIPEIFSNMTQSLKKMNFGKMYMALAIAKFHNGHFTISAAGMPQTLIYHSSDETIEELLLRGLPLGLTGFNYEQSVHPLRPGDTILMMSDGFSEMFNPKNELLGMKRAAAFFRESARQSPQDIIRHLLQAGENWADGRPQEDDVTFAVVQVTS